MGVDPGASGGLVCIKSDLVVSTAMPGTDVEVLDWFVKVSTDCECVACIEKVGGYMGGGEMCPLCKQRKNLSPGSTMFSFGEGYGGIKMAMLAAGIKYEEVHPNTWQKDFVGKGDKKTLKQRLKQAANDLFPGLRATLKTADAMLLAEYCRRRHEFVSGARRAGT